MFTSVPIKLCLGFVLLNVTQVVASTPTVAQSSTPTTTGATTVVETASVKPTLLIAQVPSRTSRIKFARGASSAVVENAVVRGTRDIYLLGAKAGQKMTVSITSLENNAVFDIIAPNLKIIKQEGTSWSTKLSATGDYRIVVGGTRGNATYKLRVQIK